MMQEDLQKLEGTLENIQQTMEKREEQLQVGPLQVEINPCACFLSFFFFFNLVNPQFFKSKKSELTFSTLNLGLWGFSDQYLHENFSKLMDTS